MDVREIVGVFTAVIVLAGLAVVVTNGGNTAAIFTSAGKSFAGVINAATLRG